MTHPLIELDALDNLWFQVAGTLCNIECRHCFNNSGPRNRSFGFMTLEMIKPYLEASQELGVKEYYLTGGEPFLNREIVPMLAETLRYGPATVLTNGMLLKESTVAALAEIESQSLYTLEFRVSLDGFTAEENDQIRGKGVFQKTMEGVQLLVRHGFLPILTATRVWEESRDAEVLEGFIKLLHSFGYTRPRLKILPTLKIGREAERSGEYTEHEVVTPEMLEGYDRGQLLCSNSRIVTDRGVYVCPILINFPEARLGETLHDALRPYPLRHQACYTCYLWGAICSNFASGGTDV
ncbi:MAG: radical SAM protein [Nitrospinota bacterium]|nr:MAG: radical SAM protein [Nitrospinota bacterium]